MANVLLFHHALGLTEGVSAFADDLRAAGHAVTTPDLYDGATFDALEDGVAHAEKIGFEEIAARGVSVATDLGDRLVVAGFSLGVLPAQQIAQTRTGVAGAILYHGAMPASQFGDGWPEGVALQIHLGERDPWAREDLEVARELIAEASGQLLVYSTKGHLVADRCHADFDPAIAAQIRDWTLAFLDRLD